MLCYGHGIQKLSRAILAAACRGRCTYSLTQTQLMPLSPLLELVAAVLDAAGRSCLLCGEDRDGLVRMCLSNGVTEYKYIRVALFFGLFASRIDSARAMSASTVLLIAFTALFARLGAAMLMRAGSGQVLGPLFMPLKVLNASPRTSPKSIEIAAATDAEIAQELMSNIRTLYADAITESGEEVDYIKLQKSSGYAQYLLLAEKLSEVQVMPSLYFTS
jgi:hypothetical protein